MPDVQLDNLEIYDFRAFHHLRIERLGRVNLIWEQLAVRGKSAIRGPLNGMFPSGLYTWGR